MSFLQVSWGQVDNIKGICQDRDSIAINSWVQVFPDSLLMTIKVSLLVLTVMRLVLLESELVIWIAENEEICKYSFLHGFSDTTILYLKPMELTFISVCIVGFTFVCIKLLLLLLYDMDVSCHRHFFLVLLLNQQ